MLFIRARCSLCQTAPATWRSSRTPLEFSDYCFASLPDGPTMSKATRLACPTPVLNVFPLFGPVIPLAHVRQGFCHAYVASPRLIVGGLTSKSLVSPVSGVSHTRHMIPSRWTIRPGWAQRLFIKRLSIGASFGQVSFMIHYRSSASFRCTMGLLESSVIATRGTSKKSPTVPHCLHVRRPLQGVVVRSGCELPTLQVQPKMPSNPDEGLHLPPLIGAAPLWALERATGVDHRKALFTRLRQHRSDDVLAGVDVHHKGSADVRMCQNSRTDQRAFQLSEGLLYRSWPFFVKSCSRYATHRQRPCWVTMCPAYRMLWYISQHFSSLTFSSMDCKRDSTSPSSLIPSAPSPSGAGKWPERHDLEQSASATSDLPMRRRMDKCAEPPAFPVMCPKCGQCAGWTVRRRM
ncbi:hypothetical protein T4B_14662 [Trichinella pseudospiralis]|uniref:Uncharacterized protein n=1 Tax=Trichinella pseudospiralis TaxID=6337 RepID=A0A0V1JDY0_TRIPS|nr:hypothetical protein T4A_7525 [Trichinella pseudospiralis]KRZ33191.1 hypothetical protein T4B_14662 [Trichinella pseudospiralis]